MKKHLFLFSAILSFICFSFISLSTHAVQIGESAPTFTLKGHDGKDYQLSQFKGKWVVLEWYNQGCPFVKKHYETGNMQGLQKKYTDQGVVWLNVISSAEGKQGYVSPSDASKLFVSEKFNSSALLLDPQGTVGKSYEAQTTPHMYIINPQGQLVYQGAIDDKPSTDTKDIQGAKNYISLALDSGMKGEKIKISKTKAYGCGVKYL